MFIAPEDFPVPANLIETPEERERLRIFRQRVISENQVGFFESPIELASGVPAAIVNCRKLLPAPKPENANRRTYLLFPWVVSEGAIDTGIVISNTGSDPFGTVGQAGVCTFHYYGTKSKGNPAAPQTSAAVMPGETLAHVFSQNTINWNLLSSRAWFSGYVIVECDFPYARGLAQVTNGSTPLVSYFATVIKRDRSGESGSSDVRVTRPRTA
jgi:hypothetical protein